MEQEQKIIHKTVKPTTEGKTAAEYTDAMLKYHREQYSDKQPPAALKWLGDAALAVPPKGRLGAAVGLMLGLIVGREVSNNFTGYRAFDNSKVAMEEVPSALKWLRGLGEKFFKNYDIKGVDRVNRNIKAVQIAIYSFFGAIGSYEGIKLAYAYKKEQNSNPQYVEDYLTAVSHHQAETWAVLSAPASILASASGMWLWGLPVPGLNYGESLVGFITGMQDRNTMIPYLNKIVSGATEASYLRLKEGSHFLCQYAVGNPSAEPTNIEFLAYTILGPLFKDKLTADHIKQFTDAVQAVRAPFCDGKNCGIPKERRAEALATMKEVFTGAGLEVLLIDMGLNPATIAFDHVNGLMGKIGDIGQKDNIKKEQEAFWKALQNRLPKYVAAGELSQERADWVVTGIEAMRHGKAAPPPPVLENETLKEHQTAAIAGISEANEAAAQNDNEKDNEKNKIHEKYEPRRTKFSNSYTGIGARFREKPISHLLKSAALEGDWAEFALDKEQNRAAPALDR